MSGLIGTKCGTTRFYTKDGAIEQCTIIRVEDNFVTMVKAGSKGGKPGQWSARKAQMLAKQYKAAGGGYT